MSSTNGMATVLQVRRSGVRIPSGASYFFFSKMSIPGLGSIELPGADKNPGPEPENSSPYSADVKH